MLIRLTAMMLFLSLCGSAQTDSVYFGSDSVTRKAPRKRLRDQPWFEKVTVGGNFQAWFGNPSFVFLSPTIGYMPVNNLNVGIGGIYNYTSVNFGAYGRFTQSIFGGHSFARYTIAESYFVQTQFDLLRQPDWYSPDVNDRVWVKYLLLGGGFRQMIGDRAALITSIMYNLTPHPFSIYPGRVILQFGFTTSL
jgi:hypothetical protein